MAVAVRDLKNRLSAYLRRARQGERILVTDRGRPVAELGPLGRGKMRAKDRLARLVELGEVTAARGSGLTEIEPMRVRGRAVAKTILDDRD
ncbi:MAG TPA: type II toxin-antitoxin system prevent-host-death family antitoxin [Polyangia bacterium]